MCRFLLNLMASMTNSFHFLTQFIRSHSLLFLNAISWIYLLKKILLVLLTVPLNLLQSNLDLEVQYSDKSLLHFSFYHDLDCLVILIHFEYLIQSLSMINANSCIILSNDLQSGILVILMYPTLLLSSLMNYTSYLLFFIIVCLLS